MTNTIFIYIGIEKTAYMYVFKNNNLAICKMATSSEAQ